MTTQDRFKKRYATGDTPWDIGRPDDNLIEMVTKGAVAPCKALEIGCGTGDNTIWLAKQGFSAVGIDTSPLAIDKAEHKARERGVACSFRVADVFAAPVAEAPFGFVFDRGCFHCYDSDEQRRRFAQAVAGCLEKDGLWLSLCGNADDTRPGPGPPRRTAAQIVCAVEPFFEILSFHSGFFGSNRPDPPRAWICLMKKRRSAEEKRRA